MAGINRERIVEAALELLDEHGLAGVTTRKIAERLGVKSASLYWHIRNRDDLLDLPPTASSSTRAGQSPPCLGGPRWKD